MRPRVLRRLLVDRAGEVEIPADYPIVTLQVQQIVAGTLDDPDYAQRPTGANTLSVVLLDEAAYAAAAHGGGMDGFAGTWTLTKLPDGELAASAIADTPWRAPAVAGRAEAIADARSSLHASTADRRMRGLLLLGQYQLYQLVPDAIALLDDPHAPIRDAAYAALHRMMLPLADDAMPDAAVRPAWDAYWRGVTGRAPALAPIAPGTTTLLARLAMNQSWPDLAILDGGVVALGVSRLDHPFDGHADGIATFAPPWDAHAWIGNDEREAFDGAGPALLSVASDDRWHLQLPGGDVALPLAGKHAAIAASGTGYAIVATREDVDALFGLVLDASGQPTGGEHRIPLNHIYPAASYHHGIHPIAMARRPGGYLVVFEGQTEISLANLDDNLALVGPVVRLSDNTDIAQAKLALSGDRALVVWTRRAERDAPRVGHDRCGRHRDEPAGAHRQRGRPRRPPGRARRRQLRGRVDRVGSRGAPGPVDARRRAHLRRRRRPRRRTVRARAGPRRQRARGRLRGRDALPVLDRRAPRHFDAVGAFFCCSFARSTCFCMTGLIASSSARTSGSVAAPMKPSSLAISRSCATIIIARNC